VKEADNILRCPHCGGRDVRRSQQRGTWDSLMLVLRRVPQRCRGCQHRFYTYLSRAAEEAHKAVDDRKADDDRTTPAGRGEIR